MYEELVSELRFTADIYRVTDNTNMQGYRLAVKAADAIEELQQTVEQMKAMVIAEAKHTEMFDERDKKTLMEMAKSLPLPEPPKEET